MTTTALTVWGQGQGSVPAAWLNRAVQNVDNMAALRATPGIDGQSVWVQGTVVQNDGGQGQFSFNSTSTDPDDNGVTAVVPFGYTTGAWLRQPVSAGTIASNSITNAQLAQAPAHTLKGNLSGVTANVADNTLTAVTAALGYATTILQGAVTLATNAQAIAGTSTTLGVTPAGLAAALSASSLGISNQGSTTITPPGASATVGTVGSSGAIIFNSTLIINWAAVQFEDVNAQTPTSWTFGSPNNGVPFAVSPLIPFATNICALAGQGANANRGVLSLNSFSNTTSSWILRDTAMTNTLGAWLVGFIGF